MNEMLQDLVGQRVRVWSAGANQDEGWLEGYDYPWLRIRNNAGEVLCFPAHNVRLVKALERAAGDHHLSPAESGEE
jgi:hypothetical protein